MKVQSKAKCSIHKEHHRKKNSSKYLKRKKARLRKGYD